MTARWTLRSNRQRWLTSASSGTDSRSTRRSDASWLVQRIDFNNTDKAPRKLKSSYGNPEDLVDLETHRDFPKKTQPQIFSMTPLPLDPDTVNDDCEMATKGLTEKEVSR